MAFILYLCVCARLFIWCKLLVPELKFFKTAVLNCFGNFNTSDPSLLSWEHSCSGTGFALKMSLSNKQKLALLHHFVIVLRCLHSSSRLTAKLDSLQRHHFPLTLESCKHSLFPLVEPCILHVLFFSAIRILFMRFDQLPADSRCLTFLLEYLGRYGALSLSLN